MLLCEEGIEEFCPERFSGKHVYIEQIEDQDDLKPDYLYSLQKKYKIERVIVEYNGMWLLSSLYENLPKQWFVYQEILFVDSTTFLSYNSNMRSLVVDKLTNAEMVIFNRPGQDTDKDEFHKIVRGITRRCSIAYELADGNMEYDEQEDPLPFDVDADVIEIDDRDFALWFRDMSEELSKYDGKTIKFKGIVAVSDKFAPNIVVCGRHVMTCCIEDISYKGLVTVLPNGVKLNNRDWVLIKAKFKFEYNKLYREKGPVLYVEEIEPAQVPEQEVATFY